MDASTFRFRESEVEELRMLLGEFGILERLGQPSDLVLRLKAAGLVQEEAVLEQFVSYLPLP